MKTIFRPVILLICLTFAAACSEWTTPESIRIESNTVNPELYAQYCEVLKDYKLNSDHNIVYTTFENVADRFNGSHILTSLPDSIDFVQLMNIDIDVVTAAEIEELREKKGTRFVLRFSYNECVAAYNEMLNAPAPASDEAEDVEGGEEETTPEPPTFEEYLSIELGKVTSAVADFGLDGFTFAYTCAKPQEMTPDKLEKVTKEQNGIMPLIQEWIDQNPDALFFFEGYPHYVLHEGIVPAADYVILPTRNAQSVGDLGYIALQAWNSGVISKETTRFLYAIETPSFIEEEFLVGQFVLGEQIPLTADWLMEDESFDKSGVAIWNVQRDYFDPKMNYSKVRKAINTINPNE